MSRVVFISPWGWWGRGIEFSSCDPGVCLLGGGGDWNEPGPVGLGTRSRLEKGEGGERDDEVKRESRESRSR